MTWMANLGDTGIGRGYIPPPDAEIQGSNDIIEVDMYRELSPFYLNTVRLYILHWLDSR
jgi:hypothetical protein